MKDINEVQIWAQMFFEDGSVSQGYRINTDVYEDEKVGAVMAQNILKDLKRDSGFLLIWGAGHIIYGRFSTSSSQESNSLASSLWLA